MLRETPLECICDEQEVMADVDFIKQKTPASTFTGKTSSVRGASHRLLFLDATLRAFQP
jgi:hypothetical protein